MISFFLLLTAIFSFVLFGVVGEDKAFLLAPVFILNYGLVLGWWIAKFEKAESQWKRFIYRWILYLVFICFVWMCDDFFFRM